MTELQKIISDAQFNMHIKQATINLLEDLYETAFDDDINEETKIGSIRCRLEEYIEIIDASLEDYDILCNLLREIDKLSDEETVKEKIKGKNMKEAFKIICDLIYQQNITYEEAYTLMEELFKKDNSNNMPGTTSWPYPVSPYSPYIEKTYPSYPKPIEVWYDNGSTTNKMPYDGKFGPIMSGSTTRDAHCTQHTYLGKQDGMCGTVTAATTNGGNEQSCTRASMSQQFKTPAYTVTTPESTSGTCGSTTYTVIGKTIDYTPTLSSEDK